MPVCNAGFADVVNASCYSFPVIQQVPNLGIDGVTFRQLLAIDALWWSSTHEGGRSGDAQCDWSFGGHATV